MIDIHTHILPNLDDGAKSMDEAIAMARMAHEDGITHIFCTPHHHWARFELEEMQFYVDQLQIILKRVGIPVQLYTGHEVHLYHKTLRDYFAGTVLSLGESPYILAEPQFDDYGTHTDELLRHFFAEGLTPIMAHPERIKPIQENLGLLEWFLEAGGLTQITAESLTRDDGVPARACVEEMLRNDMVHIIASDAHGADYRPIGLRAAREAAAAIVGEEKAWAMVKDTPQKIVDNVKEENFIDAFAEA